MTTRLTEGQLFTLASSALFFDEIEPHLSKPLQAKLLELQTRAGDAYATHWPSADEAEIRSVQGHFPTLEETQDILGSAYLALENGAEKNKLKRIMDELGLTPSQPPPGEDKGRHQ